MLGIHRPRRILGMVLAGDVDSIGKDVRLFKEGDRVFGFDPFAFGTYAEYKCLPESGVVAPIPSNLGYQDAATIPYGLSIALANRHSGTLVSKIKRFVTGQPSLIASAGAIP